jgi:prolyl oligopeptidase
LKRIELALAAALLAAPAFAATFAGVEVPAPLPPRPVTDTLFDTPVPDPYRYFEDTKDPALQAWMKSQADATAAILAKLPGRDKLLARIKEIEAASPGLTQNAVRATSGRYFFLKRDPEDNVFRLVYRDAAQGPDRTIVDPAELQKATGTPHAVMDFAPSPDGKRIAYSIQKGGGEIGTLHIVDLASGKELVRPIDRIRYASVSWLDDGNGFFYSRLREGYEKMAPTEKFGDRSRHFRALDKPEADAKVFSPLMNADLKLPIYASGFVSQVPGTQRSAAVIGLGVERYVLLYLADLEGARIGKAQWKQAVRLEDKVAEADIAGGYVYLRSSKGAPRFQVLRMPLDSPDLAKAEVVVPASESVIVATAGARDALYFVRRDGATQSLWRLPHGRDAKPVKVALPYEGAVDITGASPRVDGVVFELSAWTRMTKPFQYDPKAGAVAQLPFPKPGPMDAPPDIVAREVRYKSHDGVEVPMSILSRKDARLDGNNPTILYGYGAYGITEDPFFNPRIYAWIERGGVYAFAHVRGSGTFGEDWHMAGRKATKPNTWKDAIAAAEWLVANKYTNPKRLGIYGGSAGGIFVGRSITERPDLFAAAVPVVGVFDGPRFEMSANGVANIPEFGTVKDQGEFKALMAMSTYHAIRDGTSYPAVMLVHGVNDIRVDVWQSLKAGARFAVASTSGKPVLMRLEYDSGHGQGSTRAQLQARTTDVWSFFLWQFGEPGFQPPK